jgi:5-oxoprolinase (ATP-hydrolysing)
VLVANHPQAGGSHLPDITVITPVFSNGEKVFFVASRGHHSDIGGISPGSMPPFSKELSEEGCAIKTFKLVNQGVFDEQGITELLTMRGVDGEVMLRYPDGRPRDGTRNLSDNLSDLKAQVAANQKGILLMGDLIAQYSLEVVQAYMGHIQDSAELAVREMLRDLSLREGLQELDTLRAVDHMDDGSAIQLAVTIDRKSGGAVFDFTGTGSEVYGNTNAPKAVSYAAVIFCLRALVTRDIPLNQGCLNPVEIRSPEGCVLNPSEGAAVVRGSCLDRVCVCVCVYVIHILTLE